MSEGLAPLVQPFRIDVPRSDLEQFGRRFEEAHWPDEMPPPGWDRGVPIAYLRDLAEHVSTYRSTDNTWSAARLNHEHGDLFAGTGYGPSPTEVAVFARDGSIRGVAERHHCVVRYSEYDRGGHSASMQAPDPLVADLLAFTEQLQETT